MGKRNRSSKSKRSVLSRLPKGLPVKASSAAAASAAAKAGGNTTISPFENVAKSKRPKHAVHNKNVKGGAVAQRPQHQQSALARALQRRKVAIKNEIQSKKKANVFRDNRIGEHDDQMSAQEQNLARLVRERSRRSKRATKYSLEDDDGSNGRQILTHKGKAIDKLTAADHVILSDDDDDELYGDMMGNKGGNLDADMHFGGGSLSAQHQQQRSVYGGGGSGGTADMAELYSQRKTELDDLIMRRKLMKAERQKSKEEQVEAFADMDESFKELAGLLQFRNKAEEARLEAKAIRDRRQSEPKKNNNKDDDDDMTEWDREMKQYQYMERKVKATDRTKAPEEIAAEEAERLQKLESRRLARMNGDFDDDSLTDISDESDDEEKNNNKKNRRSNNKSTNPEALDNDSDDDDDNKDELKVRFTPDGLVYIDKNGVVVKKVGEEGEQDEEDDDGDDDEDNDNNKETATDVVLEVGTRVKANYHAKEQFQGFESWCDGVVAKVITGATTTTTNNNAVVAYDIEYDDGDYEENVEPQYVKVNEKDNKKSEEELKQEAMTKMKRQKAKEKARSEIPYVFEVPTTLDALHDIIGQYATTGEDASIIVRRIHQSNSVKLNKNNLMKMQNFNDVLIRRFIAVGDAIYESGDGGSELGRYRQLDSLTQTMYRIAHDASDSAASVWSRRLGVFQNAHAKRLRDAELYNYADDDSNDEQLLSAWPSTGVFLVLRALGHIFPVTDRRHPVVTPAMLLLGEFIAHTPIRSMYDLVMGVMIAGLLIEYNKDAKRIVPEALAFVAGVIRLYAPKQQQRQPEMFPHPSLGAAALEEPFLSLRSNAMQFDVRADLPRLSLYRKDMAMEDRMAVAILVAVLQLVEGMAVNLAGSLSSAESECFYEITSSLLELQPTKKSKKESFPPQIQKKTAAAVTAVSLARQNADTRQPLQRRPAPSARETAIKTLAPRMENPERYSLFSKDKKKSPKQAALDRTRRELKREHKAISRELRLDATLIEDSRRQEREKKDSAARTKRQKAYAWLEGEQAAMNQQVRQGGGLLAGGGTGAARAKAATGKLGMKKGGKF